MQTGTRQTSDFLAQLLDIHRETLLTRERTAFDQMTGSISRPIILCGAGDLGRKLSLGLRSVGRPAIAFVDNNSRLWGSNVDDVPVLPPTEVIQRFAQSAVFVVSVYNGSGIANQFRSAGCETVVHYASLEWKYQDAFRTKPGFGTPTLLLEDAAHILHLSSLLADEESRTELARQVRWRIAHEPEWLGENKPAGETYFPPEARPLDDEVFVDCGGFTGDTVTDFLTRRQYRFKQICAVEPDPQNLHHMKARFESLADDVRARIHILPYAVGNEDTTLHFDTQGTAGSHVSDTGTAVQCHRLDSILCDAEPTYIKMDLEGFEPKAIAGAAEVIRKHRPVMAVTLYHELNHLWNIPMQLHALNPDYKLLIRRYAEDCWEIVCYAIPPERFIPHPT